MNPEPNVQGPTKPADKLTQKQFDEAFDAFATFLFELYRLERQKQAVEQD